MEIKKILQFTDYLPYIDGLDGVHSEELYIFGIVSYSLRSKRKSNIKNEPLSFKLKMYIHIVLGFLNAIETILEFL